MSTYYDSTLQYGAFQADYPEDLLYSDTSEYEPDKYQRDIAYIFPRNLNGVSDEGLELPPPDVQQLIFPKNDTNSVSSGVSMSAISPSLGSVEPSIVTVEPIKMPALAVPSNVDREPDNAEDFQDIPSSPSDLSRDATSAEEGMIGGDDEEYMEVDEGEDDADGDDYLDSDDDEYNPDDDYVERKPTRRQSKTKKAVDAALSVKKPTPRREAQRQTKSNAPGTSRQRVSASCTTCGREFSDRTNLKRHERTHTNEQPYACDYCPRRFSQSNNCKQHMRKKHGMEPKGPIRKT